MESQHNIPAQVYRVSVRTRSRTLKCLDLNLMVFPPQHDAFYCLGAEDNSPALNPQENSIKQSVSEAAGPLRISS